MAAYRSTTKQKSEISARLAAIFTNFARQVSNFVCLIFPLVGS